jgi:predicted methyltransferase
MAHRGNEIVQKELEKIGYVEMGFEELLSKLFEDQNLITDLGIKASLVEKEFPEFENMHNRKMELFTELNNLLIELYQTSSVSIDYNKLMQGEEGAVTYFEIDTIRNRKTKERDSYINTKRVTKESTDQIVSKLNQVVKVLQEIEKKY